MADSNFYANFKVLLPICLSLLVLLGLVAVVLIIRKRSEYRRSSIRAHAQLNNPSPHDVELANETRLPDAQMVDSPSLANLQNKQNRDQQYHAVRCQSNRNSNSNESGSYKAEGNGMH